MRIQEWRLWKSHRMLAMTPIQTSDVLVLTVRQYVQHWRLCTSKNTVMSASCLACHLQLSSSTRSACCFWLPQYLDTLHIAGTGNGRVKGYSFSKTQPLVTMKTKVISCIMRGCWNDHSRTTI